MTSPHAKGAGHYRPRNARLSVLSHLAFITALLTILPKPTFACSLAGCVNRGVAMLNAFDVVVQHEGKPLPGVVIEIKTYTPDLIIVLKTVTDFKGVSHVTLPPGDYWLSAEFLGINLAYNCFHVDQRPSSDAKKVVEHTWGDFAPETDAVAGFLIDPQPGTGGTPLWNLSHYVDIPISGARLRLINALTKQAFDTTSEMLGSFDFGSVPDGTYVLTIEGGTGRSYSSTDLVLRVRRGASGDKLVVSRQESTCGTALSFRKPPRPQ